MYAGAHNAKRNRLSTWHAAMQLFCVVNDAAAHKKAAFSEKDYRLSVEMKELEEALAAATPETANVWNLRDTDDALTVAGAHIVAVDESSDDDVGAAAHVPPAAPPRGAGNSAVAVVQPLHRTPCQQPKRKAVHDGEGMHGSIGPAAPAAPVHALHGACANNAQVSVLLQREAPAQVAAERSAPVGPGLKRRRQGGDDVEESMVVNAAPGPWQVGSKVDAKDGVGY